MLWHETARAARSPQKKIHLQSAFGTLGRCGAESGRGPGLARNQGARPLKRGGVHPVSAVLAFVVAEVPGQLRHGWVHLLSASSFHAPLSRSAPHFSPVTQICPAPCLGSPCPRGPVLLTSEPLFDLLAEGGPPSAVLGRNTGSLRMQAGARYPFLLTVQGVPCVARRPSCLPAG